MKAVVFLGEGQIEIRDYPDPVPGPDEVVVRMKASGMCGSDLHHLHEPKRSEDKIIIEGHEPCGVVEAVGSAVRPSEARVGDRVMVHHYDGCRTCGECRSGWTQFCSHGRVVYGGDGHGGHADFMKVPAHTLIKLPDELSFKAGAAVSCGSGTAYGALERIELVPDDTVAIFGQGPVGLSCTMFGQGLRRACDRSGCGRRAASDGQGVRRGLCHQSAQGRSGEGHQGSDTGWAGSG